MLDGAIEDNVLTALCWSEKLAGPIIERLGDPNIFSTDAYRIVARKAFEFYEKQQRPPRPHIRDVLEPEIKRGNHGRFIEELIDDMERLAPLLIEEYVLDELDLFINIQRLTKAVEGASGKLLNCKDMPYFIETCHDLDLAIHPYLDDIAAAAEPPWPSLDDNALYGLAGEVVRTIEPHTESDPAALLFQFLTAFGSYIGRSVYFEVDGAIHHTNLYALIVGESAKARKGSSLRQVRRIFNLRDTAEWRKCWFTNALGSGEALVYRIRDQAGDDPGVDDKRLFIITEEFATQLKIMERSGSTVSGILRMGWDGDDLVSPMTKSKPIRATGPHISSIGHSTVEDIRRYLTSTDIANGFANRYLMICVRSSRLLPGGGSLDAGDLDTLSAKVEHAARYAMRHAEEIKLDGEARELWFGLEEDHRDGLYAVVKAGEPGLFGSVIGRAEAQVRRLALIYTALDQSPVTRTDHLLAGLAAWDYAFHSARHIFGDAAGHGSTADKILAALRGMPNGMPRDSIAKLFSNHQSKQRIEHALEALARNKLAECQVEATGGRPREIWRAIRR